MNRLATVGVGRCSAFERIARVRSDPDVGGHYLGLEGALDGDRRLEGRLRSRERREEAVSRLLDDLAAAVRDLLLEELVVPREQLLPFLVAERLEQSRRADDVREQKRAPRLLPAEELRSALRVCPRPDALEGCVSGIELGDRGVLF